MEKYVCTVCGYVYDPEVGDPDNGIAPGTAFADLPEDWACPLCSVGKDMFEAEQNTAGHTALAGVLRLRFTGAGCTRQKMTGSE